MEFLKRVPKWAWIVLAVIVVVFGMFVAPYNGLVSQEEEVANRQANIQSALQSRLDKINELMPSVQGIMDHESQLYRDIAALRSGMAGVKEDSQGQLSLKSNDMKSLQAADQSSSALLSGIHVAVEAYPEMKSNQNMSDFMTSIEGIENRLNVARQEYNKAVKAYNVSVRRFPTSIIAGMFGFERKALFEASDQAQSAPKVTFNR